MLVKTIPKAPHIKILNFSNEGIPLRITIREYLRNYKKYNDMVNETKEKIVVTNQDTDTIILSPVEVKKRKWSITEIREKLTFSSDPNLSSKIDEIVYGI